MPEPPSIRALKRLLDQRRQAQRSKVKEAKAKYKLENKEKVRAQRKEYWQRKKLANKRNSNDSCQNDKDSN